ncbi:ras-related and estrogen-regulated growth inhibitor-like protein [Hydra vulgaris]|uniref:ras-related and estrogen-regulated growth inhibitor-like protein n=1 Tax=Hydra vulgaris TaxID=6087 RepID=UPI0002B4A603|nr:ras-related and estrogen-regulated growth inhibitor-like protein [Hydra vulgaris]
MRDEPVVIRLAICGAKNSGKSALAVRFLTRRFIGEYDSNQDVIFERSIVLADKKVELQVNDTTEKEWIKNPQKLINWATVIVVVYSITDYGSFLVARNILNALHSIKPLCSELTLLVGNKKDLKHFRTVKKSEAKNLAMTFGMKFIECSAAENYDEIHGSFTRLFFSHLLLLKNSSDELEEETLPGRRKSFLSTLLPKPNFDQNLTNNLEQNIKGLNSAKQPEVKNASNKLSLRRKISGIGSRLVGTQVTK